MTLASNGGKKKKTFMRHITTEQQLGRACLYNNFAGLLHEFSETHLSNAITVIRIKLRIKYKRVREESRHNTKFIEHDMRMKNTSIAIISSHEFLYLQPHISTIYKPQSTTSNLLPPQLQPPPTLRRLLPQNQPHRPTTTPIPLPLLLRHPLLRPLPPAPEIRRRAPHHTLQNRLSNIRQELEPVARTARRHKQARVLRVVRDEEVAVPGIRVPADFRFRKGP